MKALEVRGVPQDIHSPDPLQCIFLRADKVLPGSERQHAHFFLRKRLLPEIAL